MSKKVSIGRPSSFDTYWIQDMKIDPFTHMIKILIPAKNRGMKWVEISEQAARDIGFINPDAILKLIQS